MIGRRCSALALLAGLAAASAAAEPPVIVEGRAQPDSIVVSYADLNIGSAAGRATLEGRVRGAARTLCLSHVVEPLDVTLDRRRCYRGAIADAGRQIDQAVTRLNGTRLAGNTSIQVAMPR